MGSSLTSGGLPESDFTGEALPDGGGSAARDGVRLVHVAKKKFERNKPHVNIGTIGHIDHGKTTPDRGDHQVPRT